MAEKPAWTPKTQVQAEAVLQQYLSLMDDHPVTTLTQSLADRSRQRLRRVPTMNGKSIYTGRIKQDCIPVADRIAAAVEAGDVPIRLGKLELNDARARRMVERLSLKMMNRDLTFLSHRGRRMERLSERRSHLDGGRNPFSGLL